MMADYGVGALGGVVLIDPTTGLPYKAGGGGGGGGAVDSVNGKTGVVVLSASDVGAATTAQGAKADTAVQPAALASKENTLTAGANITIDRTNPSAPVISASGGGAVDSVNGKTGVVVLNAADVGAATTAQGTKADSAVQPAAIANFVPNTRTVAGKALTADVTLAKGDVGLGNVDNTSDAAKPVSTAQQSALNLKAPWRPLPSLAPPRVSPRHTSALATWTTPRTPTSRSRPPRPLRSMRRWDRATRA